MARYPHFVHRIFILISAIKAIRLCDGNNGGLLRRPERTIKTTPSSLVALQLHTKKNSQSLQAPIFSPVESHSCKPDHSYLQKTSFSLCLCPIPFFLQKVSDGWYKDPSVISYADSLDAKIQKVYLSNSVQNPC